MRETITRLKQRIESNESLNQDDQQTLLDLIATLESEAGDLEQHPASQRVREAIEKADSSSINEEDDSPGPVEALQNAIQEVEAAHPRAAETLARIGNILGRMGI